MKIASMYRVSKKVGISLFLFSSLLASSQVFGGGSDPKCTGPLKLLTTTQGSKQTAPVEIVTKAGLAALTATEGMNEPAVKLGIAIVRKNLFAEFPELKSAETPLSPERKVLLDQKLNEFAGLLGTEKDLRNLAEFKPNQGRSLLNSTQVSKPAASAPLITEQGMAVLEDLAIRQGMERAGILRPISSLSLLNSTQLSSPSEPFQFVRTPFEIPVPEDLAVQRGIEILRKNFIEEFPELKSDSTPLSPERKALLNERLNEFSGLVGTEVSLRFFAWFAAFKNSLPR